MIAFLNGTVKVIEDDRAIIEVAGIGYEVRAAPTTLKNLKPGSEAGLFTVEVTREDGRDLFAFGTLEERKLFLQLIAVSGVGPRTGLQVISLGSPAEVRGAIDQGDVARLTSVPGVGAKTAQKIILELRGKLAPIEAIADSDLLTALVGLGYRREIAAKALQNLPPDLSGEEERLKTALKSLGKK